MNVGIGTTVFVQGYVGRRPKTLDDHLQNWNEYTIVEENRVSWIAQRGNWTSSRVKIDKKTLEPRGETLIAWSRDEIVHKWRESEFRSNHVYKISEALRRCDNDTIQKVAELIGYTEHLEQQ